MRRDSSVSNPPQAKDDTSYLGRLDVSPNWPSIQHALGISLKKVVQMGANSLVVTPYFGLPEPSKVPTDVFVLMSFDPKLRPIYDDHILRVAKSLNFNAKRADDFFTTHHVMSDVWEAINATRLVIADCTGRNPNVFYEIGVAHTLGRPVVLITQESSDVPFDLQAIRYIQFEYTPPGMAKFEQQFASTLRSELKIP